MSPENPNRMDGIAGALAEDWKRRAESREKISAFEAACMLQFRRELMQAFGLSDAQSEPPKGKDKGQK